MDGPARFITIAILIYNILLLEELAAAIAHDALSDLNVFQESKGLCM